tara:strand:+ start:721 stop:906 length:186 start_codon:yes stop_codon:yes gene_type:complete
MNILMIAGKVVSNPLAVTAVCGALSGYLVGRIEVADRIDTYFEELGAVMDDLGLDGTYKAD